MAGKSQQNDTGTDATSIRVHTNVSETLSTDANWGNGLRYVHRIGNVMKICDCEYLVVLEEDNCMSRAPRITPSGDVGGVPWNEMTRLGLDASFLKRHGIAVPHHDWGGVPPFVAGACGGAYYKVSSMLSLPEFSGQRSEIYDIINTEIPRTFEAVDLIGPALAYATERNVVPWEEVSENGKGFDGKRLVNKWGAIDHKCAEQLVIRRKGARLSPSDSWMVRRPEAEELNALSPEGQF